MKRIVFVITLCIMQSMSALSWTSLKWFKLEKPRVEKSASPPVAQPVEKKLQTFEQALEKGKEEINLICTSKEKDIERLGAEISIIKEQLKQAHNHAADFLNKKLSKKSQEYQTFTESEHACEQIKTTYEQTAAILKERKADATFSHLRLPEKTAYGFEEFQVLAARILNLTDKSTELEKNKISVADDVAKRKKAVTSLQKEYEKQQNLLLNGGNTTKIAEFSEVKTNELIDADIALLKAKKELAQLRLQESEAKLALVDSQIMLTRDQLDVLKSEYTRVKRHFSVDAQYVKQTQEELEAKRQFSVDMRDRLHEKIRFLTNQKEEIKQRIEVLLESYSISAPENTQIREWNREPKTIVEWLAICNIGSLFMQESVLDSEKEYLESLIELEKARFEQSKVNVDIINSWHKITQRTLRIDSEEYINNEIKNYELSASEIHADIKALTEKRSNTINLIQHLNHILDRVKTLHSNLRMQRNYIFKNNVSQFTQCMMLLNEVEDSIRKYIDVTAKLIENYSATIATDGETAKKIENIIGELTAKGFWRRSEQSIEWHEVRNFFPDLKQFFSDVVRHAKEYFAYFNKENIYEVLTNKITVPFISLWLMRLIFFAVFFLIILACIDKILFYFKHREIRVTNKFRLIILYANLFLYVIRKHIVSFYIWAIMLALIKLGFIEDVFIAILIYLLSIPYLVYIAYDFIQEFFKVNAKKGNIFLSSSYQKRFIFVISPLIYATIIIFFLREAYMLGGDPLSQVPTILLAFNFILLQIALLSLIGKEQILGIIPNNTPLWEWVEEHVNKYYYPLLLGIIAIIVMSNPYVGYGRQVLYILSHLLFTILLIPLFSWVHNKIKQNSSELFFYYTEGEAIKERFVTGKTWYGVFVIISFVFFVIAGIVIGAYIWGYKISTHDILGWLRYELYSPGLDETTGKPIIVSMFSVFQVLLYILGGIAVTYIVTYFVLRRIFDPLLVGGGVQNTIVTITRYIIVIAALLMGLNRAGLDSMATKFVLIIAGLGFALREPISDFLSYFIILVQRPIKIGDLIMLDEETKGVVRQITPRSTILRRRNSVTVIVPNSHIITKVWANWNYAPTFFAFDDIFITVPYTADPAYIKQLLLLVLEANGNVLRNPAPVVWLNNFVDNGYQFLIRGYLTADKVLDQWDIASQVRLEIVRNLREKGIQVASPTRIIITESKNGQIPSH
ncbi:MAG: mechanosensitive ion channel domain-containing protein [Candidatus Babeliaceae bacterium]